MEIIKNITRIEAEQIARAIHELRPDWPTSSLTTFITREFSNQQYANIAVALTACATALNDQGMPLAETPRYALDSQWLTLMSDTGDAIQAQQTKEKNEKERQERLTAIHERGLRIQACKHCDEHGRNEYGHICYHDLSTEDRTTRAKTHANQARQNIRSLKCQTSTTNQTATSADANAANATPSETTK